MRFSHIFVMPTPALWVSTWSPRHCGCVDTQHGGVQSVFRWLRAHFKKKTGKFCDFQKNKKCRNSAKNVRKCPKSKSPNPPIKNLFSLQISAHLVFKWPRKSKKYTFLGVPITFVISTCKKVDFLDFLGHLKAKWAEIWCEHRFLMDGLGELDFGHFWPFLAELWQKN